MRTRVPRDHTSNYPRVHVFAFAAATDRRLDVGAEIASTAALLDYRPRMHARHGQGAAAAQARPSRSKLSDYFHLWVNNIRLFYSWRNLNNLGPSQLPSDTMGNLQSDSKKKQKKKETAGLPTPTSTGESPFDAAVEDQGQNNKKDQAPKVTDGRDGSRDTIKISFEKVQPPGHAKRQAPQPPKIVLLQVRIIISLSLISRFTNIFPAPPIARRIIAREIQGKPFLHAFQPPRDRAEL